MPNNNNLVIATDFEHKGKMHLDPYNDTIGIVCGTFAPLHKGHMRLIEEAAADNFYTIVIVGGYEGDRGHARGMTLKERYKRLRVQFEGHGTIYVAMVDEGREKLFDEEAGLQEFHDSVEEILAAYVENPRHEYGVRNYVGQADYAEILSSSPIYDDQEIVLINREDADVDTYQICATDINEAPYEHWTEIADAFKCFYRKCVVLVGAESTGKSTMCRKLAGVFYGNMSKEYGRVWTEGWRHRIESDLNEEDYLAFIAGQLAANEDALYAVNSTKVTFCDTDGFVTSAYLEFDAGNMDPETVEDLKAVAHISRLWTERHADAVIVMPNDVPFELDGSRDGHLAESRDEYLNVLLDMLEGWNYDFKGRIHLLKEGTLSEKLSQCEEIVNGLFNVE